MPDSAWTEFSALTAYSDCSAATMGISDLGSANVTYPDDKVAPYLHTYLTQSSFFKFLFLVLFFQIYCHETLKFNCSY